MSTNRRDFLKAISIPVAGTLLLPGCTRKTFGPYQVLTETEADALIAMGEQLIPADEYAGATEAGVVYFFDKQLGSRGHYPDQLGFYQNAIMSLDNSCRKLHGKPFAYLQFETQTAVLREIEKGKLADPDWAGADQRQFFNTVLDHTMQAFYGAPRHGGNRQYLSYAMMGIEYPLVIGQNRYRQLKK